MTDFTYKDSKGPAMTASAMPESEWVIAVTSFGSAASVFLDRAGLEKLRAWADEALSTPDSTKEGVG